MDDKKSEKEVLLESIRKELNKMSKENLKNIKNLVLDLESDKYQGQF